MQTERKFNILRHIVYQVTYSPLYDKYRDDIQESATGDGENLEPAYYAPMFYAVWEEVEKWPDAQAGETAAALLDYDPGTDEAGRRYIEGLEEILENSPIHIAAEDEVESFTYTSASWADGNEWLGEDY